MNEERDEMEEMGTELTYRFLYHAIDPYISHSHADAESASMTITMVCQAYFKKKNSPDGTDGKGYNQYTFNYVFGLAVEKDDNGALVGGKKKLQLMSVTKRLNTVRGNRKW